MKHILFRTALCAVVLLSSCVDKEYDLSKIESEGVAIGNDQSKFYMPLLNVKFQSSNICQNVDSDEISIMQIYDKINIWVPTKLPNDASYIDIKQLSTNEQYRNDILHALYDEMGTDKTKRTSVCEYVASEYRSELSEELALSPNPNLNAVAASINQLSLSQATELLAALFLEYPDDICDILDNLSSEDIINFDLEDVIIAIPALDISEDIKDMLTSNLDPSSQSNPVNALYLFGTVESDFPFMFHISPQIVSTLIDMGDIYVDNQTTAIEQVRINREDLEVLFYGTELFMPIKLDRYYPNRDFSDNSAIEIKINLLKTGGLNL